MATIASCPNCHQAIAAPDAVDPQTWARCPLCGGQFPVQAALEIIPPSLEFIAAPNDQHPADATPAPAASPHVPDFPKLHESPHLAEHFAAIPQSQTVPQRMARKPKSFLAELVKIVLGGMAGLLLGYAILFWGFRVDPFHLAKCLPTLLVPHNLNQPVE